MLAQAVYAERLAAAVGAGRKLYPALHTLRARRVQRPLGRAAGGALRVPANAAHFSPPGFMSHTVTHPHAADRQLVLHVLSGLGSPGGQASLSIIDLGHLHFLSSGVSLSLEHVAGCSLPS